MATNIVKSAEIAAVGNYPENRLNSRERKVLEVSNQFVPADDSDWGATPPATIDDALDALAAAGPASQYGEAVASDVYDFSVNGGAVGDISLSVSLPAKAIVTEVVMDVLTPVVGSGNVKLTVATEGALQSGSADSSDSAGPQLANPAAPIKLAAARTLRATIASAVLTAGKVRWHVRYYRGE